MIKIIAVGKIKEKYLNDAVNEYIKRLSKFTKVDIVEVDDVSNLDALAILKKEGKSISKHIKDKDYVIALDIEGNKLSSIDFTLKLGNTFINYSDIVFIIGGSYGLDESIKERANYKLSFSDLTFPHQLFRVMLLEQIYRAYKISNNEEYHK